MTKILITPKNSVWGVIVNPQSSNTYRHALSFDTPQIKEDFINKELFSGGDYKAELAKQPEQSFTRFSATSAKFRVDPADYPNETFVSLLNKDFCIIEEDGIEQFYTLSAERSNTSGMIDYIAELDIFFTDDITTMFNSKDTEIKRGMYPRFIMDNNGEIKYRENYLSTPLINKEVFDNQVPELLSPTDEKQKLNNKISWRLQTDADAGAPSEPINTEQSAWIQNYLNELKWEIVSVATKAGENIPIVVEPKTFKKIDNPYYKDYDNITVVAGKDGSLLSLPYVNFIAPSYLPSAEIGDFPITNNISLEINWIEKDTDPSLPNSNVAFTPFTRKFLENPAVLKNSLQILPFSPLEMLSNLDIRVSLYDTELNNEYILYIYISYKDNTTERNSDIFRAPTANTSDNPADGSAIIGLRSLERSDTEFISDLSPHKNTLIKLDPSNPRNKNLEPKLDLSPYTLFKLGSSTKFSGVIKPENFTKNEVILRMSNSYLPSNWGYLIELKNYFNINSSNSFIEANRDYTFEDFANYQVPTDKDSWEEFNIRNQSQQSASFTNKGIGLGLGVLGAIAAPFTGGASLGLSAIALGSVAAKSASDINSQIAQRKDIKNTPNQIENSGSIFPYDFATKSINPFLQKYTLDPITSDQIFDHIYKYGYSFENKLNNVNLFLKTRYWFNYIEASDTFENIILQASAEIKQIINDTLEKGLTVWHVRDLKTFNGIKNYDNENVEMIYLSSNKRIK